MLKTILTFLVLYLIFRFIGRKLFANLAKGVQAKPIAQSPNVITDKIHPCPTCKTYNPSKEALYRNGQYYCNERCFDQMENTV